MNKAFIKRCIVAAIWIAAALLILKSGLISSDYEKYLQLAADYKGYIIPIFVLLSIARVFIFFPGLIFMVLGGIVFDPITAFLLSMASMILSETIIYLAAGTFKSLHFMAKFAEKHSNLIPLIERYSCSFLCLGIICPVAPSDVICFLSAMAGMSYRKYILTVILSNIPAMLLYSYLGESINNSIFNFLITMLVIVIFTIYTINIWNKISRKAQPYINNNDSKP